MVEQGAEDSPTRESENELERHVKEVAPGPFKGLGLFISDFHRGKIIGHQWMLAAILSTIFGLTIIGVLLMNAFACRLGLDPRDVRDLAATLITPQVALLGSVFGFYYAERRRSG
jgi:hypothetical protein